MERCPFCGDEMRRGLVRTRGLLFAAGLWASGVTVNFEVDDDSGEGSELLRPGWLGRGKRGASCCVACEAVVVDPKRPRSAGVESEPEVGLEPTT